MTHVVVVRALPTASDTPSAVNDLPCYLDHNNFNVVVPDPDAPANRVNHVLASDEGGRESEGWSEVNRVNRESSWVLREDSCARRRSDSAPTPQTTITTDTITSV